MNSPLICIIEKEHLGNYQVFMYLLARAGKTAACVKIAQSELILNHADTFNF